MISKSFKKNVMEIKSKPIEIVYFVFPSCDGNCAHCWSSNIQLGTVVSREQHEMNLKKLSALNVGEIKLSGGEPFFNKNIGSIVDSVKSLFLNSKITIFTSGRPFVSNKLGEEGIVETYNNLCKYIQDFNDISIQLSADEYHADALKRLNKDSSLTKEEMLKIHVQNFIGACDKIRKKFYRFEFKLKVHVNHGRLEYHKNELYDWLGNNFWENNVIKSEGLIKSGNAENIKNSIVLEPSDHWSLFVLPGTNLVDDSEKYISLFNDEFDNKKLKLVPNSKEGVVIAGWWNLINKQACYCNLSDISSVFSSD